MVISIKDHKLAAQIYDGQLVSFSNNGRELFHGGGKPEGLKTDFDKHGWQNSEILMFPVIGQVKDYLVYVGGEDFLQDKHGVSHLIPFKTRDKGDNWASFFQQHAGRYHLIPNKNLAEETERPTELEWPFGFQIDKKFELENGALTASFSINNHSNEVMPYMFGWHPAFKSQPGWTFEVDKKKISLDSIVEAVHVRLDGAKTITYGKGEEGFELQAKGFRSLMLWSPDPRMFCIETLTSLPLEGDTVYFKGGAHDNLGPFSERRYSVSIKVR